MTVDINREDRRARDWVNNAVRLIEMETTRSADTHLLKLVLPEQWKVQIYVKDESTHPTGSLKHRLAKSLFLYALCNGWLHRDSVVIDASSGSTAISEAYFASLLGLRFIAVIPKVTSAEKVALIQREGGQCHFVDDASQLHTHALELAASLGGCFLDQFTFADRATDWRGNNNIAESIFAQMALEQHPIPSWIVVGAGTGGTSSTIGRHRVDGVGLSIHPELD